MCAEQKKVELRVELTVATGFPRLGSLGFGTSNLSVFPVFVPSSFDTHQQRIFFLHLHPEPYGSFRKLGVPYFGVL